MLFSCDDYPMGEGRVKVNEEEYPFIVRDIMEYIDEIKSKETGGFHAALLDIILDFAFKRGFDIEAVGDAIADDQYFKSFIEKDCELHNIIKSDSLQMEDW